MLLCGDRHAGEQTAATVLPNLVKRNSESPQKSGREFHTNFVSIPHNIQHPSIPRRIISHPFSCFTPCAKPIASHVDDQIPSRPITEYHAHQSAIMTALFIQIFFIACVGCNAFNAVVLSRRAATSCRTGPPSLLYSSEDDDLDSLLSSEDERDNLVVDSGLTKERLPFQTDGGVIMPEGGANPCVIKVS